jgi:fatty-acyl-CoA synthase
VATIAPNTHAQLESFYAVPQLGAVLVPINYRLTPEDFVYIVNHSGATVVCAAREYLAAVDGVRDRMPEVRHFVAFEGGASEGGASEGGASEGRASEGGASEGSAYEGGADGWLDFEAAIAAADPGFARPEIGERDLLSINYTSGTTARPKGVMITHRNAAMNTIGTLLHLPMGVGSRYLWTLPMFHANGWTYTWTVTASAGTHVCLRKVDPATIFGLIRDEKVSWLCAAPTVLISLANAPAAARGEVPPGVHVVTAGAPPAAATIERLEGEFGWEVTQVYGLTETAPFITICAPVPEHEGLPPADRAGGAQPRPSVASTLPCLQFRGSWHPKLQANRRGPGGRLAGRGGCGRSEDYQSYASARLRYSNSSFLSNHRFTSYSASARLPEACTRFATALPVVLATALD